MNKQFLGALLLSPVLLGIVAVSGQAKEATSPDAKPTIGVKADRSQPQPIVAADEDSTMDQVTSVSQLTDVRPTDWAFQALQSLVERYGCIVGYPDRTFRGNQALTRYEFAAGLNSCLDRVNELIAAGTAGLVRKEDLDVLQRLQEEFRAELTTLRGRVDALEARTTTINKQQFSTTTKLNGEVVAAITGIATGEDAFGNR
ncbi:MAG TPA: iron uptake porin, partial [Thermosynechococcaceae cyanobacterium]